MLVGKPLQKTFRHALSSAASIIGLRPHMKNPRLRRGIFTKLSSCSCDSPCIDNPYGRCVYTYPYRNLGLSSGIPRGADHWDNLYDHRVLIERSIRLLKYHLGTASRKSFSSRTAKADPYIAGIAHLIGVIIAVASDNSKLFKSVRKLFSA